eukprot:TRINITY_DN1186_c0_g1_i19.p1 TRINITY_DN1186_c0_g1~~TRINITY_DN1186_c0_g1_i19.p1  ORF type:complete len:527 (+),score=148.94 TRINITY_DN1186_c0_g1_i19:1258-2838(+)
MEAQYPWLAAQQLQQGSIDQGIRYAELAIQHDLAGEYGSAFALYCAAVTLFLNGLRVQSVSARARPLIYAKADELINRAEALKVWLHSPAGAHQLPQVAEIQQQLDPPPPPPPRRRPLPPTPMRRADSCSTLQQQQLQRQQQGLLESPQDFPEDCLVSASLKQVVDKVNKNYALVCMIMMGVRNAILSRASGFKDDSPDEHRFCFCKSVPRDSCPIMSEHDFDFLDYAPLTFSRLRNLSGINEMEFLESFTLQRGLIELRSPGKSGSFFYGTTDMKYIIKTVTEDEHNVLRGFLSDYRRHIEGNRDSLLVRFYGLHSISATPMAAGPNPVGPGMRFVVMQNIFPPDTRMVHERYDIKGSTQGRYASQKELMHAQPILKDCDLVVGPRKRILLGPVKRALFLKTIADDCRFLERHLIMDYSLLIGIQKQKQDAGGSLPLKQSTTLISGSIFSCEEGGYGATDDYDLPCGERYYLGIIDILQPYNMRKKVEHALKAITAQEKEEISCVDPAKYSKRFRDFIKKVCSPQ